MRPRISPRGLPRLFSGVLRVAPAGKRALLPHSPCFRRGIPQRWALPIRMRPPLFFCLAKRKVAAAAVEKKSAISKLAAERKFGEYGSQLFCSKTCLPLRGTGGVRCACPALYAVTVRAQTSGCKEDTFHSSFRAPRSAQRCLVPQMSGSASGTRSRERPLCSPANTVPPDAGAQFRKERLSAQPVGGFGACMAVRDGGPLVLGELAPWGLTHP